MQVFLNSGPGVSVVNTTSSMPFINGDHNPITGTLRYNNNNFQVYDGYSWQNIPTVNCTIGLDEKTQRAIEYVSSLQEREVRLKERANNIPAIADLLRQRTEIDDKLNMIDTLIK